MLALPEPPADPLPISRRNFVELCHRLTAEDEKVFEQLWRRLGLSIDWSQTYQTIGTNSQRVSQLAATGCEAPHPLRQAMVTASLACQLVRQAAPSAPC